MSAPSRFLCSVAAALFGADLVLPSASAQVAGSNNPYTTRTNPIPYNTSALGKVPPLGLGYNLATNPYSTTVASVPAVTQPTGSAYSNPPTGYGNYNGYPQILTGAGSKLQGQASLTAASGQYQVNIQQARILREQSRQASLDTQRKRLVAEIEYEDLKNQRYRQVVEMNRQAVLDKARRDPQDTDIWSGMTLNVLLKSILAAPAPTRGPNIELSQDTLHGLNLSDGISRGSLAMAKDDGKIEWTDALQDASFDTSRNRFTENFVKAMKAAQEGEKSDRSTLKDLQSDLKSLGDQLDDEVTTLSPDSYMASRRLLNKLKDALKGLSTDRIIASCNSSWRKDVRTVADLVAYCQQKGVEFGAAAAEGDRVRYQAAWLAIRAYERGTVQLASAQ